jgi:hypothetical protein
MSPQFLCFDKDNPGAEKRRPTSNTAQSTCFDTDDPVTGIVYQLE